MTDQSVRLFAFNTGWFQCRPGYFVEGDEGDYLRGPVPAYLIEHPAGPSAQKSQITAVDPNTDQPVSSAL